MMIEANDFGMIYKGRGHMNDPNSYGHISERLAHELEQNNFNNLAFEEDEEEKETGPTGDDEESPTGMNFQS